MTDRTINAPTARSLKSAQDVRAALATKQSGGRILTPGEGADAVLEFVQNGRNEVRRLLDGTERK